MGVANIPDGFSNTFLIVEAGEAVPWTKPEDIAYDANKPVAKLGGIFPEGFQACIADGSVWFIDRKIKDATLHKLINPADGQVLGFDEIPTIPPRRDYRPGRKGDRPESGIRPPETKKEPPKLPAKD